MKKIKISLMFQYAVFGIALLLFTACGNDEKDSIIENNKENVAKTLKFKVNFDDYNADKEVQATRAGGAMNDTLIKQNINISDGIRAEVIVQRDTTKVSAQAKTRTLEDGKYTMLAYQAGVFKGEVTGYITSGYYDTGTLDPYGYPQYAWGTFFNYTDNHTIELEPGTYEFVLFNDKVTRNGNNLTVDRANAETALIGRTTYTVNSTSRHQQVTFQMKHVSTRIRIKWMSYTPIVNPKGQSWANFGTVTQAVYDAATGTWSTGASTGHTTSMTYTTLSYADTNGFYSATSDYVYYLPPVNAGETRFDMGGLGASQSTTYNGSPIRFNFRLQQLPTLSSMTLDANSSYLITFKLMYNFIYLMSDGTTGHFGDTTYGGGSKTPVAIVLSQSKRLAAALKDANGGAKLNWYYKDVWPFYVQNNDRMFTLPAQAENYVDDMNGYHYTWDASGSYDGITIKANEQTKYPAFYYAAHYGSELDADLFAKKGIHLTNGLENKRWHLPSMGEWTYFFTALGLGDKTNYRFSDYYKTELFSVWTGGLAKAGFDQVGGSLFISSPALYLPYYTSTEYDNRTLGRNILAGAIYTYLPNFYWVHVFEFYDDPKFGMAKAFIYY